jgi:hypothetical protein
VRGVVLTLAVLTATPLLAQPPALPAAPTLTVTLAPKAPTVGDHVVATLTLRVRTADLAAEPRFPVWGKSWGEAEVFRNSEPVRIAEQGGVATWEQKVEVVPFRPGAVALPPVAVALPLKTGTVQTATPAALALAVRSVIPANEKAPQAKPPAPPRPLALGARFWWTVAGLGAACLAALALLWLQHRKRARAARARPALPPLAELLAEVAGLAAEPSMLALHTRLSFALRRYLGRRLPFPAVESTTGEVQTQLAGRRMPGPLARQTVELLRACDLVKFARQEVGSAQGRARAEAAARLGEEWETHLAPVRPAGSEESIEPERLEATG